MRSGRGRRMTSVWSQSWSHPCAHLRRRSLPSCRKSWSRLAAQYRSIPSFISCDRQTKSLARLSRSRTASCWSRARARWERLRCSRADCNRRAAPAQKSCSRIFRNSMPRISNQSKRSLWRWPNCSQTNSILKSFQIRSGRRGAGRAWTSSATCGAKCSAKFPARSCGDSTKLTVSLPVPSAAKSSVSFAHGTTSGRLIRRVPGSVWRSPSSMRPKRISSSQTLTSRLSMSARDWRSKTSPLNRWRNSTGVTARPWADRLRSRASFVSWAASLT